MPEIQSPANQNRRLRTVSVSVLLPRSIAQEARREVYSYPFPKQRQLRRRTLRYNLNYYHEPYVRTKVRIRVPRVLPLVRRSYVSLSGIRPRLSIYSSAATNSAIERGELNRARYLDGKSNRRKARNGQLDSPGANAYGILGRSVKAGMSIARLADSALVARAMSGRW